MCDGHQLHQVVKQNWISLEIAFCCSDQKKVFCFRIWIAKLNSWKWHLIKCICLQHRVEAVETSREIDVLWCCNVLLFVSQFGIFMFSLNNTKCLQLCIKMRLNIVFLLLQHRNRKLHIAESWWWRSLSLCAHHFHMGSWTCINFLPALCPCSTNAASSPREFFRVALAKNCAMKREKLICRRRKGSRNLWCILRRVSSSFFFAWITFVWGWALIYFPIHFII